MVKDRRVVDSGGNYRVYSRMAKKRRKHHTGAAVLALALDAFKTAVLLAHKSGNMRRVEAWVEALGLESEEALLTAARRPTLIVPATITFYPIRVNDNILRKVGELLSRGLSRRLSEELLIEGNILLKDTDMDVRLGEPVQPPRFWRWWERKIMTRLGRKIDSLDGFFGLMPEGGRRNARFIARRMGGKARKIRDEYMHRMYTGVTVHLSHLASSIILTLVDKGQTEIDQGLFRKILYLAVKDAQKESSLHLHRSLRDPQGYSGVLQGRCPGLERFLNTTVSMDLVEEVRGRYRFLPKLCQEHEFDEIRLENLVVVYANEVEPLAGVSRSVEQSIEKASLLDAQTMAKLRFDDQLIAYSWDRKSFSKPRYEEVNQQETFTESGEPFLLLPQESKELGVVLVHGFTASPAEVRPFGERLHSLGLSCDGSTTEGSRYISLGSPREELAGLAGAGARRFSGIVGVCAPPLPSRILNRRRPVTSSGR